MYSSARGLPGQSQAGLQLTKAATHTQRQQKGRLGTWCSGPAGRLQAADQTERQTDRHARRTGDRPDTQDAHWVRTKWRRGDFGSLRLAAGPEGLTGRSALGQLRRKAVPDRCGAESEEKGRCAVGGQSMDPWTGFAFSGQTYPGTKGCSCGRAGLEKTRNPAK